MEYRPSFYPILFLGMVLAMLVACKSNRQGTAEEQTDTTEVVSLLPELPDSTLWGHLGEDTGMSVLQFVTDQGDTLDVYRTNQYTGEDGILLGEIRDLTDRYAITLDANGENLLVGINVTQLMQDWDMPDGSMAFKSDGKVESPNLPYTTWRLWNGHILLSSTQQLEYGTVSRIDTMEIVCLDSDSLAIRTSMDKTLNFKHNK